jgi:tripartite-type tricarboxylate transporter receptor subunit TctC
VIFRNSPFQHDHPLDLCQSALDTRRDLSGIIPLGQFPNVLVVPPTGFGTIRDLVAAAKAKPGVLTFGSDGIGGAVHLTTLSVERRL